MGYFNNKIFATANPYRVTAYDTKRRPITDIAFGGMVALSVDNLANLTQAGVPGWDGLWTICRPMDFLTLNNRFYVISKDDSSHNEIYEILPEVTYDSDGTNIRPIKSILYTREHDFQSVTQNKDLFSLVMGVHNVKGDFKLDVKFKPSHGAYYVDWGYFEHLAPWRNCLVPDNCLLNGYAPHNFKSITFGVPTQFNFCDPVNDLKYGNVREVQLRIEFEGIFWELQEYTINAKLTPQNQLQNICDKYNSVAICDQCDINAKDWTIGPFKSCQSLQT